MHNIAFYIDAYVGKGSSNLCGLHRYSYLLTYLSSNIFLFLCIYLIKMNYPKTVSASVHLYIIEMKGDPLTLVIGIFQFSKYNSRIYTFMQQE